MTYSRAKDCLWTEDQTVEASTSCSQTVVACTKLTSTRLHSGNTTRIRTNCWLSNTRYRLQQLLWRMTSISTRIWRMESDVTLLWFTAVLTTTTTDAKSQTLKHQRRSILQTYTRNYAKHVESVVGDRYRHDTIAIFYRALKYRQAASASVPSNLKTLYKSVIYLSIYLSI